MRFCEYNNCSIPVFGTDKLTRKGYCKSHQFARTDLDKRSIVQKAMSKHEKTKVRSLRSLPENIEMVEKALSQNEWYLLQRNKMTGKCCNCGCNTQKNDSKYYKWNIAHVFPKSIFKSTSKNDDNWIELCLTCHTLFDRNLATASKMKCFKEAVAKYQKFKNEIIETHKFKNIFEEYANQL